MGDGPARGGRGRASRCARFVTFPGRWVLSWKLWSLPRRVLGLVLIVNVATIASVLSTAWAFPVRPAHWIVASILTVAGLLHLEMARGIERLRAKEAGRGPYHDLKTVWGVTALLLLPPLLATGVVVACHTYGFLRIHRDDKNPHRWTYSCATVVLGSQMAALILAVGVDAFPGFPSPDLREWVVVVAAMFIRWLINYLLIILVAGLMRPEMTFRDAFVQLSEQVSEAAATGLAILAAAMIAFGYYALLVCLFPVIGVLQQTSFYHHWKRERPYDASTAVYTRMAFIEQARAILDRAHFRGDSIGCLLLDLDHFKNINDSHGHQVGDKALVELAQAIKEEIREDKDLPARWGGEEFVVLIPEVTPAQLYDVAERIRYRVSVTQVPYTVSDKTTQEKRTVSVQMTVSIGAAMFPDPDNAGNEERLLDFIERADKLMYEAKHRGRNRVCAALPADPETTDVPDQSRTAEGPDDVGHETEITTLGAPVPDTDSSQR